MAWNGIAMYAALAIGAPVGVQLFETHGFAAVAVIAIFCPVLGLLSTFAAPEHTASPLRPAITRR
jgi:predicted MFS family arabinose efflux permease